MILDRGDSDGSVGQVTLDHIFRRTAERRPEAAALCLPAEPAHRLSFADVERAVAALAQRFAALGLPHDSVIALQGTASPAHLCAILAAERAGLVPMLLPELWRELDLVAALEGSGARALIATDAGDELGERHCRAAAEVFAVRFVCALARTAIDGVVPFGNLETLLAGDAGGGPAARADLGANHLAVLTWDVGPDGPYLVPRSHRALIAGAVQTLLAARLDDRAVLVSTISMSNFAGLTASCGAWLLSGGTLAFAPAPMPSAGLVDILARLAATHAFLPAELAGALAAEGALARCPALRCALLLNHAPERAPPAWLVNGPADGPAAVDITSWGEAALLARRRDGPERACAVPARAATTQHAVDPVAGAVVGHRTLQGTLALSGAMVPAVAYPSAAGAGLPLTADGAYDTGWTCHAAPDLSGLLSDAPPRGVARVGGYRLSLRDVETKLAKLVEAPVDVTALPHRALGQRVVATTEAPASAQTGEALPLVTLTAASTRRTA